MNSQETTKKSRTVRTTALQYEELVKYMETHSEFASNKFLTKEGKIHHNQQWNELQQMLNSLYNGPGKTTKQWQTEYQIQLENGNESILQNPPAITSIGDIINVENIRHINMNDNAVIRVPEKDDLNDCDNELSYADILQCCDNETVQKNTAVERRATNRRALNINEKRNREILQNKKNKQRIGIQLQEAREKFSQIAESHAEALHLLSEASMKQAEAALLRAQTEERRLEFEERRFAFEERKFRIDEQLVQVLNNLQEVVNKMLNKE